MFKNYIHFIDNKTLDVEVFTKTGLLVGEGELCFSKEIVPSVSFGLRANISKFSKNTFFRCEATVGTYTLFNCEVVDNTILPKLIVKGGRDKNNRFKKISVLLQGVSEWMDSDSQFKITNQEIIRKLEQKVFNVDVLDSDGRLFSISSEHWCETKRHEANSHLLKIYTMITCEVKTGYWSVLELIKKTHDVRTFFSLLLGFSVGVEYVLDRTHPNRTKSVYFLNATTEKNPVPRSIDCFVSSAYLFKQNKWADILKNFFNVNAVVFNDVWSRVAGLLSYDGFWEYRIFAYVSLVDKYVSLRSKTSDKELPGKKFKNSRFLSFAEKFEHTMSKMNAAIREIIDLSDKDFNHLKKLRNAIAHGDSPSTKNDGDITYEVILNSKLALLLLYWVYSDLGFCDKDFIVFLSNWFYPTTRQASLNTQTLDKALGRHFYLNTNKTNFAEAKKQQFGCLVLDYIKRSDSYRVNKKATARLEGWHRNFDKSRKRSVEEELMSIVDTSRVKNIAYVVLAYMQHEDEVFKINMGTCILNCPDFIAVDKHVFDRLRIFDDESKQWLPSEFEK